MGLNLICTSEILPTRSVGRGTTRRVVEGYLHRWNYPSTTPLRGAVPLPEQSSGRI